MTFLRAAQARFAVFTVALVTASLAGAQGGAPGTPQPAGGAGRGGAPVQGAEEDLPLVARFDRDGNKLLNRAERLAAREFLAANPPPRPGGRGGRAGAAPVTGTPGERLSPSAVQTYPQSVPLYDGGALRTLFLTFENDDWEDELDAFWHTDVEVPATLVVDGKAYRDVGVSFRGNNSFTAVPKGLKRPLSLTIDFVHDQKLLGHTSLNLLNANQDPSFLRSVLFLEIARRYIPAPKANFVRVVINGESWGVYVNQQTFSKEFLRESFATTKGTRWKSPNNSVGGGFGHLGDDIARYRRWYEMKGGDDTTAWKALAAATKVLDSTPPERLAAALAPVMNVDAVLRFLALDVALVNGDGYWRDGSDFNLYLDAGNRFMLIPHDVNEGFRVGGRGANNGAQPEPLTTLDDANKALRRRLLAVPALRTQYLKYVGDIADQWLDWNRLGPIVAKYEALIAGDVARDTRKLATTEAFVAGIHGATDGSPPVATTIKGFASLRRAALLAHPEIIAVLDTTNSRRTTP
jgi:hypothetical protein